MLSFANPKETEGLVFS